MALAEWVIDEDGVCSSWYCAVCGKELGADISDPLHNPSGEPSQGCPEHGKADIGWETWSVETEPTYPHRVVA